MDVKKRIPLNMTMEEEIKFWEENDLTHYLDDTCEEEIHLSDEFKKEILYNYYNREVKIAKSAMPKYILQLNTSNSQGMFKCEPKCNSADNHNIKYEETLSLVI